MKLFAITDSYTKKNYGGCMMPKKKNECWQASLRSIFQQQLFNWSKKKPYLLPKAKKKHFFYYLFKLNQQKSSVTKLLSIVLRFVSDWRMSDKFKIRLCNNFIQSIFLLIVQQTTFIWLFHRAFCNCWQ